MQTPERKTRIALIVQSEISSGGAANYESNLVKELINSQNFDEFEFLVLRTHRGKLAINVQSSEYRIGITDLFLIGLYGQPILQRLFRNYSSKFEKLLSKESIDLVYFLSPNTLSKVLRNKPYISTVWDLGHRNQPAFPELSQKNEWESRELLYSEVLPKSFHVFTDTAATCKELEHYYGIDHERTSSIGLFPSVNLSEITELPVTVGKVPFFVYPAQFWPHKNHKVLIDAARILKQRNIPFQIVFTGSDKGNKSYIRSLINDYDLSSHFEDLGYVSREVLVSLISRAEALLMPSVMGNSNLPPLEASMLGKPSILSHVHQYDFPVNGAIFVNGFAPEEWAAAMERCLSEKMEFQKLEQVDNLWKIKAVFIDFAQLRSLWSPE